MGSTIFGCIRATGCSFRKSGFSNACYHFHCVLVIDSNDSSSDPTAQLGDVYRVCTLFHPFGTSRRSQFDYIG